MTSSDPLNPSPTLSDLIDEMTAWFVLWNKNIMTSCSGECETPEASSFLPSFELWRSSLGSSFPADQPAVERLAELRDHLQRLVRLVLMKKTDKEPIDSRDYEILASDFLAFFEEARRLEKALAEAASGLDSLTGLRSRIGLFEELRREHSRFYRGGKPFCVAIMDLDFFKKVNDTHGHPVGDKVLAFVANHVSRMLRLSDDAYRFGGEEFLLCLKDANLADGFMVLDRLRISLEQATLSLVDGNHLKITASFGVAVAEKNMSIEDIVSKADQALYEAKTSGRNRVIKAKEGAF